MRLLLSFLILLNPLNDDGDTDAGDSGPNRSWRDVLLHSVLLLLLQLLLVFAVQR